MAKRGGAGGGRSGGGGGEPAPAANSGPPAPPGVTRRQDGGVDRFSTNVDGEPVSVEFVTLGRGNETDISFSVRGQANRIDRLNPETANRISSKIREIVNFKISTASNGEKFQARASNEDGRGTGRALALTRAGLSAPRQVGDIQRGTVRNGRLVPDISARQQASRIRALRQQGRREREDRGVQLVPRNRPRSVNRPASRPPSGAAF